MLGHHYVMEDNLIMDCCIHEDIVLSESRDFLFMTGKQHLFCFYQLHKMSSSRFGPGRFSENDERLIFTGHWDEEAWVTDLQNYVISRKERCLDADYPPIEWLSTVSK